MKRPPSPRSLALRALEVLERRDAFADAALDGLLRDHPDLAPRDRSLLSHLVYGVLRWRNRLDAHLSRAADRPLRRLHPRVLQILRLGAYQILFLDRVPNRAAVSESVELARAAGQAHAAGFVNAVLRTLAAAGPELEWPTPLGPAERLALLFGCPSWLVERWSEEYGEDGAEALCKAASRIPSLWLRVDTRRCSREDALDRLRQAGLTAEAGAFAPEAVLVASAGDPRALPLVSEGLAVVQDQASQLVAHAVAPEPGWRILDACAAPGLKATHLAALAGPDARVTALDLHAHRVRQIEELARQLGCSGIAAAVADARAYASPAPFDAVLVDAPCSGLGVLSRTPEAKWRRTPESLLDLPALQRELLEHLAECVRPGGVLVYATCTTLRAENEEVVEAFLSGRPDFAPEPPPAGGAVWEGLLSGPGYLRTFPDACAGEGAASLDGFFAARLRRRGAP